GPGFPCVSSSQREMPALDVAVPAEFVVLCQKNLCFFRPWAILRVSLIRKRNPKQTDVHNHPKEPHELALRRSRTTTRAGHGRRAGGPGARRNGFERHTDLARRDGKLAALRQGQGRRSEEHTSELQSPYDLVCRLLLEKKKKK